jgi:ElaB/YqjD/DUF883 family membrane-anchored ribosome-binding protein
MNTKIATNGGTVEASKDKLVNDIKAVIGDADGLLKSVASSAVDELSTARNRVESQIGEVKSRLNVARAEATRRACDAAGAADTFAHDNPWKLFGISALAGLLIGIVLTRR